MRERRRLPRGARIPTASMADIAFLLLIFFLTSTIFRLETGLEVDLPRADSGIGAARTRSAHIWLDRTGELAVDDRIVDLETLEQVLGAKLRASGELIVSLQIDEEVPYEMVDRLIGALRRANIRNVRLGTEEDPAAP
ncbi:MAG: hypothetical protein GF346_06935 [Candidatus Eisenbacteria bacterium]|nr:hypothetical protein [Candidatus Latescibacterota bacterium]MBD3302164.1 hypothetical protein [Candidatus Eisenbacteria bacterium]